jgi:hypothetical protein
MSRKAFHSFFSFILALAVSFAGVVPAYAAPSNDNFADATQITGLPYFVFADNTGATFEIDEPASCSVGNPLKTEWFAYTPPTDASLTAMVGNSGFSTLLGVYKGISLNSLALIGCQNGGLNNKKPITFQAEAGVAYYFQMSGIYDWNEGLIPFTLQVTPPPEVLIFYEPSDPSIFDNVYIFGDISDLPGIYGNNYAWTIWDGTTLDGGSFYHQFASDGDYPVNLIYTTDDGRSSSASRVVQVRTKDVAIKDFSIPKTARVNQTITINVDIQNKRYSDYVQVTLVKGLPGGGEQVIDTLTLYVPAKTKKATTFKFCYTFTPDDAAIGEVTFKTVATIVNGRDAFSQNNERLFSIKVKQKK